METATPQDLQLAGQSIAGGRYAVRSKLGEGNMGLVYLAHDQNLGTDVVLKVPTAAALTDPEFVERFQREIRSLVKLTHPHIVTVLDVGKHAEVPYVVLQYLAGKSLRDRQVDGQRRQHPMSLASLKDWLVSIAAALDFIHGQGYIHRDVKPANILFDHHGNAFLSDFGLAKVLSSQAESKQDAALTGAGFLVGTPNYIAPELIMGRPADGGVDQYSLAMTVYEALAGKVPVEGPSASATMVNQTRMKIPPISEYQASVPDAVSEVILRALSKNPVKRFANCKEFAEAVLESTGTVRRAASASSAVTPSSALSGKISRGQPGRVPCPQCGKILPLKPQFGGRKARCAKCLSLLLIGPDIASLKLIEAAPPAEEPADAGDHGLQEAPRVRSRASQKIATDTLRGQNSQTRKSSLTGSGDVETLLGEEVFGYRFDKKTISIIAGTLVFLLIGVALWLGRQSTAVERADAEKKKQLDKMGDREEFIRIPVGEANSEGQPTGGTVAPMNTTAPAVTVPVTPAVVAPVEEPESSG